MDEYQREQLRAVEIALCSINGYVARDKDGSLWFHYKEPHKENDIEETWWGSNDKTFEIFDSDFPQFKDLRWPQEPVKVQLTIHLSQ